MNNNLILKLIKVSKVYPLYQKPRDRLKEFFFRKKYHTDFVALKDINLTIRKGESLGIIGDNGAGKSTLLQIISGILPPSSGKVIRKGKVLAILELGIGFHPELTGRENIFNYANILGYDSNSVKAKLESIIDFAELGNFIDQPIKTYSSGMLMRLAFSLLANLEPDVLVIDEALAVGDLAFQKKCIDKIIEYRRKGGTLLFCSHSLYHVSRVSDRVIWIDKGRIRMEGHPEETISAYEWYVLEKERSKSKSTEFVSSVNNNVVQITRFELETKENLKRGDDLIFRVETSAVNQSTPYHLAVSIKVPTGWGVYVAATHFDNIKPIVGNRVIRLYFPQVPLLGGNYFAVARLLDDSGMILYDEKEIELFSLEKKHGEIGTCYLEHYWEVS